MIQDPPNLYDLFPRYVRFRDQKLPDKPLEALMRALQVPFDELHNNISDLWDGWFIETCAPWMVPYIGDLIGVRGLDDPTHNIATQRAQVANTLAFRRRSGNLAAFENAVANATGWAVQAKDYRQIRAHTQHMEAVDVRSGGSLDLRAKELPLPSESVFTPGFQTCRISGIGSRCLRSGIEMKIGEVSAYPVAFTYGRPMEPDPERFFTFSPWGVDQPLFQRPATPYAGLSQRQSRHLPLPMGRPEMARWMNALAEKSAIPEVLGSVSSMYIDTGSLGAATVWIRDLSNWRSLIDREAWPEDKEVAIDPRLGRFAFKRPGNNVVPTGYTYGAMMDLGGGPYSRPRGATGMELEPNWKALVYRNARLGLAEMLLGLSEPDCIPRYQDLWNLALIELYLRGQPENPAVYSSVLQAIQAWQVLHGEVDLIPLDADSDLAYEMEGAGESGTPKESPLTEGDRDTGAPNPGEDGRSPATSHLRKSPFLNQAIADDGTAFLSDASKTTWRGLIQIRDSALYGIGRAPRGEEPTPVDIAITAGESLVIEAAQGHCPYIEGRLQIYDPETLEIEDPQGPLSTSEEGTALAAGKESLAEHGKASRNVKQEAAVRGRTQDPSAYPGALRLDGLWLRGGISLAGEVSLDVFHCTVQPPIPGVVCPALAEADADQLEKGGPKGSKELTDNDSSVVQFGRIWIERSIVGPIRLTDQRRVVLVESLLDMGEERVDGWVVGPPEDQPGSDFGPVVEMANCTIFGTVRAEHLQARNTLFTCPVESRARRGVLDSCYVPHGSSVGPTRGPVGPPVGSPASGGEAIPLFVSQRFGDPGYGALATNTDARLLTGADDGGEIGVFHPLFRAQRRDNFQTVLEDYVPWGTFVHSSYMTPSSGVWRYRDAERRQFLRERAARRAAHSEEERS